MIPRLYEIDDGQVLLDGIDVNRIPLATLRRSIAMVPQESFLFSMSLADNIAYGLPETDLAQVTMGRLREAGKLELKLILNGFDGCAGTSIVLRTAW